ncbi:hypothetical protein GCM10020367_43610 [Streptomyces sannanensis]|uniref:histidine kinase n=1 Tax=Streptomyces sannanensis TaxID=285536 RepID=A0ABP6SFS4_9ACTN
MQKKRPRGKDGTPTERTVRVRSRLVVSVAVVALAIAGAAAPAVIGASAQLTESTQLADLAALDQQAVTLAHSLADERDEVTAYIAAGREKGLPRELSARVDRQIAEIRATAPAALGRKLDTVPDVRRTAVTGKGSALAAHKAYSEVIAELQSVADEIAEKTPPRAAEATRAPAALGRAVEQASATRGLLLAALAVPREEPHTSYDPVTGLMVEAEDKGSARDRDALSAAAQQARVGELAALADFTRAASPTARESFTATVSGPEVNTAERHLASLTDRPELSDEDLKTSREKAGSALSARLDLMRGVEASLATAQVERLEALRDDDFTALQIRVGLAGLCLLIAVGASTAVARTLTRPLAVLRLGAARLASAPSAAEAEPVRFTGRNDEFAQVVRSINTLHSRLAEAEARAGKLADERGHQIDGRKKLAADREKLLAERTALQERATGLQEQVAELDARLEAARHRVERTLVNLALRNLGLVERQLAVIEGLEDREQDSEQLATLFKLDHLATVIRRHSENLLVLAGSEHVHQTAGPVPLVDVLRAAVSEIERYERVDIQPLPPQARIAGFAADDLSHLVAELLENATSFSPPEAKVKLSGRLLESGEVMLSVQDEGIGLSEGRRTELNVRLADPESYEPGEPGTDGGGLGLHVAALLAKRLGVRVELREQDDSPGITAVAVLPETMLTSVPPAVPAQGTPGSVAEADSHTLPAPRMPAAPAEPDTHERTPDGEDTILVDEPTFTMRLPETDVVIEAAEAAVAAAESETEAPESEAGRPAPESEAEASEAEASEAETPEAEAPETETPEAGRPASEAADPAPQVTDKGLPKRTPNIVKAGPAPEMRRGGVDAEALRRKLGGFHQGAKDGRRDAETEISEAAAARTAAEEAGETVEEARS